MPRRTRVKICGVCEPEAAILAARAGAHAIGLVFYEAASRCVTTDLARRIIAALPPFVTPVALFVDATTDAILRTTRELGLSNVQLHGHETPAQVRELKPLTVMKSIPVDADFTQTLSSWRDAIRSLELTNLAGLVLETAGTAAPGGTGVANDWAAVEKAQQDGKFEGLPRLIAAGGLRPETVGDVVRRIRPYAVDVSSGVEGSLRQKSEEKIHAFVAAVRAADAEE